MNDICDFPRCKRHTVTGYYPVTNKAVVPVEMCQHHWGMLAACVGRERDKFWSRLGYNPATVYEAQKIGRRAVQMAKKTKKVAKKSSKKVARTAPTKDSVQRQTGKTTDMSIRECWVQQFKENEKRPRNKRLTDAQIQAWMNKEFPGRTAKSFTHVTEMPAVRRDYNVGAFTQGVPPKTQSKRYDETGEAIVGRAGKSKTDKTGKKAKTVKVKVRRSKKVKK